MWCCGGGGSSSSDGGDGGVGDGVDGDGRFKTDESGDGDGRFKTDEKSHLIFFRGFVPIPKKIMDGFEQFASRRLRMRFAMLGFFYNGYNSLPPDPKGDAFRATLSFSTNMMTAKQEESSQETPKEIQILPKVEGWGRD